MDQKYSLIISPNFEDEQGFWPKISQESAYTNFKLKKEKKKKPSQRERKKKTTQLYDVLYNDSGEISEENPAFQVRMGTKGRESKGER